jgi:putative membrane protein
MQYETYQTLKSLHIIFMVSWFAGLFYIVRLFIYHTEAQKKTETENKILSHQFIIMEKKLWWIITTPAMVLTLLFGIWMLFINPALLDQKWMLIKLGFVAMLLFYHAVCQKIMFDLIQNRFNWTSNGLRIWNELATLVLVAVVFLVELQGSMNWLKATIGFFGVAILLMIGIKLYKRLRSKGA